MKNKFMITISDIHGVKQYTMHQFIKQFVMWIMATIVLIIAIGTLVLYSLSDEVDELNNLTQNLQDTKEQLAIQNGDLQNNILRKSETLNSMNEQLAEYGNVMASEKLVNWVKLMDQIKQRLQVQALNNKNITRVSYGTF